MKILLTCLIFVISLSIPLYADDAFLDKDISELQLIRVIIEEEKAWIQDVDGTKIKVIIGDAIGAEEAVVTEIKAAYISVQTGNTKTKIPISYGFE